jgi:hypothetical protein
MNSFKTGWNRWFAWHPVETVEGKWACLRYVWRFYETIWDGYWLYSDRPDFTSKVFAETLAKDSDLFDGTRARRV